MLIFDIIVLFFGLILLFKFLNINDKSNVNKNLLYKLYLFIYVFLLLATTDMITNLILKQPINIENTISSSINSAFIAIFAYVTYDELMYNNFFKDYSNEQNVSTLILLIILFISSVKVVQMFISPVV